MGDRNTDILELRVGFPEGIEFGNEQPVKRLSDEIKDTAKKMLNKEIKLENSFIGRGASGFALSVDLNMVLQYIGNFADVFGLIGGITGFVSWLKIRIKESCISKPLFSFGFLKMLCINHVINTNFKTLEIVSFNELAGSGPYYEGYDYYSCIILQDRESKMPKIITIIINAYGEILGSNAININEFNGMFTRQSLFKIEK